MFRDTVYHSQWLCSVSEHEELIYITAKGYAVSLNMRHSFISQLKGYMQYVQRYCIALDCDINECLMFRNTVQRHCIALGCDINE
jgi:hypothetical protein